MARDLDAQVEAALAKKFSAEMATRSVTACMQAMGAVGLFPQNGYDRLLTSARIVAYVDGTTEMQNERIGAALLKRAMAVFRRFRPVKVLLPLLGEVLGAAQKAHPAVLNF